MARSKNRDSRWKTKCSKESKRSRKETGRRFRAQVKQILYAIIGNEDNASFPIDPRTTGWETH